MSSKNAPYRLSIRVKRKRSEAVSLVNSMSTCTIPQHENPHEPTLGQASNNWPASSRLESHRCQSTFSASAPNQADLHRPCVLVLCRLRRNPRNTSQSRKNVRFKV